MKKSRKKIPIYEKFPDLEQNADLHHALMNEIGAEDNVRVRKLKGQELANYLVKIAD